MSLTPKRNYASPAERRATWVANTNKDRQEVTGDAGAALDPLTDAFVEALVDFEMPIVDGWNTTNDDYGKELIRPYEAIRATQQLREQYASGKPQIERLLGELIARAESLLASDQGNTQLESEISGRIQFVRAAFERVAKNWEGEFERAISHFRAAQTEQATAVREARESPGRTGSPRKRLYSLDEKCGLDGSSITGGRPFGRHQGIYLEDD